MRGRLALAIAVATMAGSIASAQVPPSSPVVLTFSEHVAPIVYGKCIGCHRADGAAPMALVTFRDVIPFAASIREQLLASRMPPWHNAPKYGMVPETPRLTRAEIDIIVRWVDEGGREGDPERLPRLPVLPTPPVPKPRHAP